MSNLAFTLGVIAYIAGGYALGRAHSEWLQGRERQRLAKTPQTTKGPGAENHAPRTS